MTKHDDCLKANDWSETFKRLRAIELKIAAITGIAIGCSFISGWFLNNLYNRFESSFIDFSNKLQAAQMNVVEQRTILKRIEKEMDKGGLKND